MSIKAKNHKILKKIVLIIIFLFTFVYFSTTVVSQNKIAIADTYYRKGEVCLQSNDFHNAKSYFEQAYNIYKEINEVFKTNKALNRLGDSLFGLGKYKEAFDNKLKALEIFSRLKSKNGIKAVIIEMSRQTYLLSLNSKFVDKNWTETIRTHLSSVDELVQLFPGLYSITSSLYLIAYNLTIIAYDDIAEKVYGKCIHIHDNWQYKKEDIPYYTAIKQNLLSTILNRGAIYEKNKNYEYAVSHYRKVIDMAFDYKFFASILPALDGLDTIYRKAGNKKNADKYYNYVVKKLVKEMDYYSASNIIFFFANKMSYNKNNTFKDITNRYQKALSVLGTKNYNDYLSLDTIHKKHLAIKILLQHANYNINNSYYEKALEQLNFSLRIYELFKLDKESFSIDDIIKKIYLNLGKANAGLKKLENAEKTYIKAIAYCEREKNYYELAKYFIILAKFENDYANKSSLAIELYNKALKHNNKGKEKQANIGYNYFEQEKEIIYNKALAYYKIRDYDNALQEFNKIKKMFLKQKIFSTESKTNQIKYNLSSYKMISYLYKKLKKGESSYNYTEYARLWSFWESILRNNALGGIELSMKNTTYTLQLHQILDDINKSSFDREKAMIYEPDKVDSIATIHAYGENYYKSHTNIEKLYNAYNNLLDKLVSINPKIKNIFDSSITTAKNIKGQKFIPEDTAILVYSMNYNYYSRPLLFLICKNKVKKYTELSRQQYHKLVKDYLSKIQNKKSNNYKDLSKKLYKYLIKPIEKDIEGFKHLIIVPDGALNYLPFESLINKNDKFLIEKYNISYTPSVSTYRKLLRKEKIQKGFQTKKAPLFIIGGEVFKENNLNNSGTEQKLNNYIKSYNLQLDSLDDKKIPEYLTSLKLPIKTKIKLNKEIKSLSEVFYPDDSAEYSYSVINGNTSTEKTFRQNNNSKNFRNYLMLHIATQVLNIEPFSSYIIFSDENKSDINEDRYFKLSDIFSLKMDSDLVILDQVSNIFGYKITGESIINTINAFIYSGARNVLISLWQKDLNVNIDFLKLFYKNVKKVYEKNKYVPYSELLHKVKLSFLNKEKYNHPYYWANIILHGSK